jgi:hypothetical protein
LYLLIYLIKRANLDWGVDFFLSESSDEGRDGADEKYRCVDSGDAVVDVSLEATLDGDENGGLEGSDAAFVSDGRNVETSQRCGLPETFSNESVIMRLFHRETMKRWSLVASEEWRA